MEQHDQARNFHDVTERKVVKMLNTPEYRSLDDHLRQGIDSYVAQALNNDFISEVYSRNIFTTLRNLIYDTARKAKSVEQLFGGLDESKLVKASRNYSSGVSELKAVEVLDRGVATRQEIPGRRSLSPHDIPFIPSRYTREKVIRLIARNLGIDKVAESDEEILKLNTCYRYAIRHYSKYLGLPVPDSLRSLSITGQGSLWELAQIAKIKKEKGKIWYPDERGPVACCLLKIASARYHAMERQITTFFRVRKNLYDKIRIDPPHEHPWFIGEIDEEHHEYQVRKGAKKKIHTIATHAITEKEGMRRLISLMDSSPSYDSSSWQREGYGVSEYVKNKEDVTTIIMLHSQKMVRHRDRVDTEIKTPATIRYGGGVPAEKIEPIRLYLTRHGIDVHLTKMPSGSPYECTLQYDIGPDPESEKVSDQGIPFWIRVVLDNETSLTKNNYVQEASSKIRELSRLLGYVPDDYIIAQVKDVSRRATRNDGSRLFSEEDITKYLEGDLKKWSHTPVGKMGHLHSPREQHGRLSETGLLTPPRK